MSRLKWSQVEKDIRRVRSPLRVVVVDPTEPDWRAVLKLVEREQLGLRFEVAGEERPVSEIGPWLFARGAASGRVTITHAGVEFVRTHWDRREVVLEVEPEQLTGQDSLDAVLAFMSGMLQATGKPVELEGTGVETELLARVEREDAGVVAHWRPTVSLASASPKSGELGAGPAVACGAVGCLVLFGVLALLILLLGGEVSIDPLGLLLLLAIGGVIGLIVWCIYSAVRKSVR